MEPNFTSFSELYSLYRDNCEKENQKYFCRPAFTGIFDKLNLSLFSPRNDQCDVCCGYETSNTLEAEYNQHIQMKEMARSAKDGVKERASNDNTVKVITVILQILLLSPLLKANSMYYKTKLIFSFIKNNHTKRLVMFLYCRRRGPMRSMGQDKRNGKLNIVFLIQLNYIRHAKQTITCRKEDILCLFSMVKKLNIREK